ncbi:MAG: RNA polymerase sigma factor [Polyangiaceae bacterium]|nr:RNA polymerase sigma factor [Polyangiaceae bacterium]
MPMTARGPEAAPPPTIGALSGFPDEAAALRPVIRATIACVLGEPADHPDVEDCAHEALARAIEGRARLREGEPLRPWVLGIARHVALDALRRRRRARRVEGAPAREDEGAPAEQIEDPGPSPEERAASLERAQRLQGALARLTEPQREALLAFHVEGLNYQQIARRLEIPLGTVATWIARGRRSLAEALGE